MSFQSSWDGFSLWSNLFGRVLWPYPVYWDIRAKRFRINPSLSLVSYFCEGFFVLFLNIIVTTLFLYANIFTSGESKTSLLGACTCGFILIISQFALTVTYLWLTTGEDFMTARRELERLDADLRNCE
jgi:hypothetical protein